MKVTHLGEWALKTLTAIAFALSAWCLWQVAEIKGRVSVVEKVQLTQNSVLSNAIDLKERVAVIEKAQVRSIEELKDVEKAGSVSFKAHDTLDQQRDIDLRQRIARTEVAIDKLAVASEKISVIQNDVAWIKEEIKKGTKP